MTFLEAVTTGIETDRPRKVVIHGLEGVGKSFWAARHDSPLFIRTEDGCGDLDVSRTPVIRSWGDLLGCVQEVIIATAEEGCPYKTVVLDSADWAESLGLKDIANRNFDTSFGQGSQEIERMFRRVLDGLSIICQNGCEVVVIAHSAMQPVRRTDGGEYDTMTPKLTKRSNAALKEWADEIAFLEQRVVVKQETGKFNSTRGIGVGTGDPDDLPGSCDHWH